jgi:hypothetical protein
MLHTLCHRHPHGGCPCCRTCPSFYFSQGIPSLSPSRRYGSPGKRYGIASAEEPKSEQSTSPPGGAAGVGVGWGCGEGCGDSEGCGDGEGCGEGVGGGEGVGCEVLGAGVGSSVHAAPPIPLPLSVSAASSSADKLQSPRPAARASSWAARKRSTCFTFGGKVASWAYPSFRSVSLNISSSVG